MSWLLNDSDFFAALSSHDNRRHRLEVTVHDGSDTAPLRQSVQEAIEYLSRDGERWWFSLRADADELLVEHRGQMKQLHVPALEEPIDGIAISARVLLEADVASGPLHVEGQHSEPTSLSRGGKTTFGKGASADGHVPDSSLAMEHCLIVSDLAGGLWIADRGTRVGTFLNGRPIVSARLCGGDVLQLGKFAWSFQGSLRCLTPLEPISGASIEARQIAVANRLQPLDLKVQAGEFVAIVGPSGSGKSTLLKALLAGPGTRYQGAVKIGGHDAEEQPEQFRAELGYVSQEPALHRDLPAQEAVRFSALVRGKQVSNDEVVFRLRSLDLNEQVHERPVGKLSGGESKRVRVAAELAGKPNCLLLDEPGSGLDSERERKLIRLLKTLSVQGCTVLIVTHNLQELDWFDRVVVVRDKLIAFDGTPAEFKIYCPGPDHDLKGANFPVQLTAGPTVNGHRKRRRRVRQFGSPADRTRREAKQLIQREAGRLWRSWFMRLLVPLVVLPLVFAFLLDVAVRPVDRNLLGFLAVLSCIWMGGSLTLTTIVDERAVIDYERLLFLHFTPYIMAKSIVGWSIAIVQTAVFAGILQWLRLARGEDAALLGWFPWVVVSLCLVSCAAVGLGLIISAVAKWAESNELAHFLFPLVMMSQMVLSVQVCNPDKNGVGEIAKYGDFTWKQAENGGTVSWGARGSYLTLSRYGDILLRTFAYTTKDFDGFIGRENSKHRNPEFRSTQHFWFRSTAGLLLLATVAFAMIAKLLLYLAERFPRATFEDQWDGVRRASNRVFTNLGPISGSH